MSLQLAIPALILSVAAHAAAQDAPAEQRESMVRDQIVSRGIRDQSTLRAMRTVQRHLFVPEDWVDEAYEDRPLPIGYGQTISQPYIVAYMTELMRPRKGMRVLEIGTGSGYQAAILAEVVDSVFTVEIITELAASSAERLRRLGCRNVRVRNADGYDGWREAAPFDAIIVTAAAEYVPPPLIEQLKEGGRMVIPVGMPFLVQTLVMIEKRGGRVFSEQLIPVKFVPLTRGR